MPTITSSLVPTITPGTLFSRLTSDTSISIRWITSQDPVYFEAVNRPLADLALRQLIIAKTLDQVNLRLGHQALFPFLVQAKFASGTSVFDVPASWIWDLHVSLPRKWENVRLSKIKRISGTNGDATADSFTGKLRLVFTAQVEGSATEVAVFQADYKIDSFLTYQPSRISIPSALEEPLVIDAGEAATIDGFIVFRTLSTDDESVQDFLLAVEPPVAATDSDSDGSFDTPAVYEIVDSPAGGGTVDDDYTLAGLSHGTGVLVPSAFNAIPPLDSDINSWLTSTNYPFGSSATLASASPAGITIPKALFKEFDIVAPAGDEPTGSLSGTFFPVWINRIGRDDASADTLTFYFATFNVAVPSLVPVEFASLTLERDYESNQIVEIVPTNDLMLIDGTAEEYQQGFGRGHVVLSSLWGGTTAAIDDFFDSFITILDDPADAVFIKESTRLQALAVSRVPKYAPTLGQSEALKGSRDGVDVPGSTNRYVVEADQGIGDEVDFATHPDIPADKRENPKISRYGYTGSLAHRFVKMVVDASGDKSDLVYSTDILPRLRVLYGRDPIDFDHWWDGSRIKVFIDGVWVTG